MELTYSQKGDYQFPNLILEEQEGTIGKYGMLRWTFLKENKTDWYQSMLLSGKLEKHLMEIDKTAGERVTQITNQLLKAYPAPDKETKSMEWIAHMNCLTSMAEEVILTELIYR